MRPRDFGLSFRYGFSNLHAKLVRSIRIRLLTLRFFTSDIPSVGFCHDERLSYLSHLAPRMDYRSQQVDGITYRVASNAIGDGTSSN